MEGGPVFVTGFTENIAILTRVAPATPPGSDDSDLREYQLQEKTNSPKKLKNELTWCRRPVPADPHFLSSFPSRPISTLACTSWGLFTNVFSSGEKTSSHDGIHLSSGGRVLVWLPRIDSGEEQEDFAWRLSPRNPLRLPAKGKASYLSSHPPAFNTRRNLCKSTFHSVIFWGCK